MEKKKNLKYVKPELHQSHFSFSACLDGSSASATAQCEGGSTEHEGQCAPNGSSAVTNTLTEWACTTGSVALSTAHLGCSTGDTAACNYAVNSCSSNGNSATTSSCLSGSSAAELTP